MQYVCVHILALIGLMSALNDDSIINQIILINPQNLEELSKIPAKRAKTQ